MLCQPLRGCSCNFCYLILDLVGSQGTSQLLRQVCFTITYAGKTGCIGSLSMGRIESESMMHVLLQWVQMACEA